MQEEPLFSHVREVPVDPIFGINDLFLKDPRRSKVNLTVGIFIDDEGRAAEILPSVHLAEEEILRIAKTKNYLPIDGDSEYIEATKKLVFGELSNRSIYGAQTIGGTSALRILAEFIKNEISSRLVLSDPTWENHENLFRRVGFTLDKYPYPQGMYEYLSKLPKKTVVVLHAMCHNPTGHDLTREEWERLEKLFREKELIPLFDSAYQGFGIGLDEDAEAIRYFIERGHECFVAHSFSKSLALYGERVGALFVAMKDPSYEDRIRRNIRSLIRTNYSNPPRHGAHIAKLILKRRDLRLIWEQEMERARKRMQSIRKEFAEKLSKKISDNFDSIREGHGFFALLGLDKEKTDRLLQEFAIYTAGRSRVNLTALTKENIDIVVDAIAKVYE